MGFRIPDTGYRRMGKLCGTQQNFGRKQRNLFVARAINTNRASIKFLLQSGYFVWSNPQEVVKTVVASAPRLMMVSRVRRRELRPARKPHPCHSPTFILAYFATRRCIWGESDAMSAADETGLNSFSSNALTWKC